MFCNIVGCFKRCSFQALFAFRAAVTRRRAAATQIAVARAAAQEKLYIASISMCLRPRGHRGVGWRGLERNMRNLLMAIVVASMSWIHNAEAQSATVDPESIVPLPDKFEMETPAPD